MICGGSGGSPNPGGEPGNGGHGGDEDPGAGDEGFFAPEEPRRRERRDVKVPFKSLGMDAVFDPCVTPAGVYTPNFVMMCPNGEHGGSCHKRRGCTAAFEAVHGVSEPLAFLHAWSRIHWPSRPGVPSHARENPSKDEVARVVAEHAAELLEDVRKCGR